MQWYEISKPNLNTPTTFYLSDLFYIWILYSKVNSLLLCNMFVMFSVPEDNNLPSTVGNTQTQSVTLIRFKSDI